MSKTLEINRPGGLWSLAAEKMKSVEFNGTLGHSYGLERGRGSGVSNAVPKFFSFMRLHPPPTLAVEITCIYAYLSSVQL